MKLDGSKIRAERGCDRFSRRRGYFVSFEELKGFFESVDLSTARSIGGRLIRDARRNEFLRAWVYKLLASLARPIRTSSGANRRSREAYARTCVVFQAEERAVAACQ